MTNCGTRSYAAPEVMMGGKYNYKADIWSLGILICELVGGFTPFNRDSDLFELSNNGSIGSPGKKQIDPQQMIELANKGNLSLPKNLNKVTRDLIIKILVPDPN